MGRLRRASRRRDRPAARGLPVPALERRGRGPIRAQRRDAEPARPAEPNAHPRRGARALAAGRTRRRAGGGVLPAGGPRDARRRWCRATPQEREPTARASLSGARSRGLDDGRRARRTPAAVETRVRHLRGGSVVAGHRRAGRRRAGRDARAAPRSRYTGPLPMPRRRATHDDRLQHRLLLPPRGPWPAVRDERRLRHPGRVARARRAGVAQARPAPARRADRRWLVGRLRDDPGPQRADWRSAEPRPAVSCTPPASRGTAFSRRPPSARSCATSTCGASRSWTSQRSLLDAPSGASENVV